MFDKILNISQFLNIYARITQDSEQNALLQIFDRVLNMPLVLKLQGYREL